MQDYAPLLTPVPLANGVLLKNRLVLSPMTTNSSTQEGYISQEDIDYALRRSDSAPLQITGAAYIEPYGQLFEYGFSIDDDRCIEGLSKLAQAMKASGAKAIIQLTHAGRFANQAILDLGVVYGPSPMRLHSPIPHQVLEMSPRKIQQVIRQYGDATRRAIRAGFDGVEISAAQRLLIQTFFSKFSNKRTDEYGCSNLEDRSRFCLDVMREVQRVIDQEAPKDFILGYRATPEETRGKEVGYTVEEFNQHIDWILEIAHLDYLAIASWGHHIYQNRVRAAGGFQGQLINKVVHDHLAGRIPMIASGGINSVETALEALEHAELVGMSSTFVTEPDFVAKLEQGLSEQIDLSVKIEDIEELGIPQAAFKDIVRMMDYGESLPKESRDTLRTLEKNYENKNKVED